MKLLNDPRFMRMLNGTTYTKDDPAPDVIEVSKTYVVTKGKFKGKRVFVSCIIKDGSVLGSFDSEFAIIGSEIVIKLKPIKTRNG